MPPVMPEDQAASCQPSRGRLWGVVAHGLGKYVTMAGGNPSGCRLKSRAVTGPGGYPRRFNSYVLLKPLARGGMGQLYMALSGTPGLEKLCVIKQVIPDLIAPENARRFRDEAMVALRLAHGNMVSVFDAGMEDGQIFLAMEHVDGKDLLATWNRCAKSASPSPSTSRSTSSKRSSARWSTRTPSRT